MVGVKLNKNIDWHDTVAPVSDMVQQRPSLCHPKMCVHNDFSTDYFIIVSIVIVYQRLTAKIFW